MSDSLGKNCSFDKIERGVILNLISDAWRGGKVTSEDIADTFKSIRMKVGFSDEERAKIKTLKIVPLAPVPQDPASVVENPKAD